MSHFTDNLQQKLKTSSAGIATFNPDRNQLIDTFKELGGVSEVFRLSHRGKAESLMKEAGIHYLMSGSLVPGWEK